MRSARGEHLGQQLPVADLVGIEPDRVGRVPGSRVRPAEREEGPRAVFVRGVVAGMRSQCSVGQAEDLLVIAALERRPDVVEACHGIGSIGCE